MTSFICSIGIVDFTNIHFYLEVGVIFCERQKYSMNDIQVFMLGLRRLGLISAVGTPLFYEDARNRF